MPIYEVIITDVTNYGSLFCVAGWDVTRKTMVRPEPHSAKATEESSRFWDGQWAGPGKFFSIGNIVQFEAALPPGEFPFPHATEDRLWVRATSNAPVGFLTNAEIVARVGVSLGMQAAFGNGLIRPASGKAYVRKDFIGPSLAALNVSPTNISFFEHTFEEKRKLRARFTDGSVRYDLPVTADSARARWHSEGLDTLRADLASCSRVHLRLGLSRPFPHRPDECYAQINGLFLL